MKNRVLLFLLIFFPVAAFSAEFLTDDNVVIEEPESEDIYVAAGSITASALIDGDMIMAAGDITVSDTISGDINAAGGDIFIAAVILDDIRIAGGNITISGTVKGDLIIAGGTVDITSTAEVEGDLVITGGTVTSRGIIHGEMMVRGGEFSFYGTVHGPSSVSADEVTLNGSFTGPLEISATNLKVNRAANFNGPVRYWLPEEKEFPAGGVNASYDSSLEPEGFQWTDAAFPGVLLFIGYGLSMFIVLMFLVSLFRRTFITAGEFAVENFSNSLGWGILFIMGMPVVIGILFITLIGIPLAFFAGAVYFILFLLSGVITAAAGAAWIEKKYHQRWGFWQFLLVAFVVYAAMKIILLIPVAGFLIYLILSAVAFGALFNVINERRKYRQALG